MNYTKGEWTREEVNDQLICLKELRDGAYYYIAEIWQPNGMPDEEYEANAHLIAAAPDMYEALKMLVYDIRKEDAASAKVWGLLHTADKLDRILTKAEGKEGS